MEGGDTGTLVYRPMRRRRGFGVVAACGAVVAVVLATARLGSAAGVSAAATPIKHIVVVFQENHSFDDVFGRFCVDQAHGTIVRAGLNMPCDGVVTGTLATGETIPLPPAPDIVPNVAHSVAAQRTAVDGGAMDGFSNIVGCKQAQGYACYQTFDPSSIPNLTHLAESFAMSDRTFSLVGSPSWGGHLAIAAATTDGFTGDNPKKVGSGPYRTGWGCDSQRDAMWWNGSKFEAVPSCIPDQAGNGPYRKSPVSYVPTIFDRLDDAGLPWKIYSGATASTDTIPYGWAICPSFYECFGSAQRTNVSPTAQVVSDASSGHLPSFSIVTPTLDVSQHNFYSMAVGDNWIGRVVSAVRNGPDWSSTAVFIVYDDCGCFYDHVDPTQFGPTWGIRLPVVIVSPFAKAGYTDSMPATLASFLAYTEHVFGLQSLGAADATAYDFANSFDYSKRGGAPFEATTTTIPSTERLQIAARRPPVRDPT
jgi:phospholipase C